MAEVSGHENAWPRHQLTELVLMSFCRFVCDRQFRWLEMSHAASPTALVECFQEYADVQHSRASRADWLVLMAMPS
eukprot:759035-Amphidinium_carterae.1